MALRQTGSELHNYRFNRICTCPAARCQQFHTNGTAIHNETFFDAWLNHTHEWWRKWEILREYQMQQNVWNAIFTHIACQFGLLINRIHTNVPFEQIVVDQFHLRNRERRESWIFRLARAACFTRNLPRKSNRSSVVVTFEFLYILSSNVSSELSYLLIWDGLLSSNMAIFHCELYRNGKLITIILRNLIDLLDPTVVTVAQDFFQLHHVHLLHHVRFCPPNVWKFSEWLTQPSLWVETTCRERFEQSERKKPNFLYNKINLVLSFHRIEDSSLWDTNTHIDTNAHAPESSS